MKRLVAVVAGLVIAALAVLVQPAPYHLDADGSALADRVAAAVGDDDAGYRGLSVALVDGPRVESAVIGDPAGTPEFETGSVAKVLTGALLAVLVKDGTVRADDTFGALLPGLAGAEVGDVTLAELASHRSGLPRLAPGNLVRTAWTNLSGGNPYGQDAAAVIRAAGDAELGDGRGEVHYSNLGMALLGQALAARAGTTYPELVTERILRPLGMTSTDLAVTDPTGLAQGSTAGGRPVDAWSGTGYAPAGIGTRSTAPDLAKLVAATMNGTAPGADAATPRFDAGDDRRIGYAWFTDRVDGRDVTSHNGGTGGFRTYIGFDADAGRGVVVLGNTDRDVDAIGLRLLGVDASDERPFTPAALAVTVVFLGYLLVALPVLATTPSGGSGRWRPAPDRLRVIVGVLSAATVALLVHRMGAWLVVPPLVWSVAVGVAGAAAAVLVLRARALPLLAGGSPVARWVGVVTSIVIDLAVIVAALVIW